MPCQYKIVALVILKTGAVYRTAVASRPNPNPPSWDEVQKIFGVKESADWKKEGTFATDLQSACRGLGVPLKAVRHHPAEANVLRITIRTREKKVVAFAS